MVFNHVLQEAKILDLSKYDSGEMFIEFAVTKSKGKNKIPVIMKCSGDISRFFNNNQKKYDDVSDFIDDMEYEFLSNYGYGETRHYPKKIKQFIMDKQSLSDLKDSIISYAAMASNKNKSLAYDDKTAGRKEKNPGWDMHILWRKNKTSGSFEPRIEYATKRYGVVINTDEVEKKDGKLKR